MEEKVICTHCGTVIKDEDYDTIYGEPICSDCVADHTVTCDNCGAIIWDSDAISDESTILCSMCYDNHTLAAMNVMISFITIMPMSMTVNIIVINAMMRFVRMIQFMSITISQSLFSTAAIPDISVWSLKLTSVVRTAVMPKGYLKLPMMAVN